MSNVTSVDLSPPQFHLLTTETLPVTIEWEDLVGKGSSLSIPYANLYDQANNVAVPNGFLNSYGVNGTQAQYVFQGPYLQRGHKYWAIFSVNKGAQVYKQRLEVVVN